jgi:hypothetical protein
MLGIGGLCLVAGVVLGAELVRQRLPLPTASGPTNPALVWYVECEPDGRAMGPYETVTRCTSELSALQATCRVPLVDGKPNPAFLAFEPYCREALNATRCGCRFVALYATPRTAS